MNGLQGVLISATVVLSVSFSSTCAAEQPKKNLSVDRAESAPHIKAYNEVLALAKNWRETDKAWYVKEKLLITAANRIQAEFSPDLWVKELTEVYENSSRLLDSHASSVAYESAMAGEEIVIYDWMKEKTKERGLEKEKFYAALAAKSGDSSFLSTIKTLTDFFIEVGVDSHKAEHVMIQSCDAARDFVRYPTYWQCRRGVVVALFPEDAITQQFLIDAEMIAYRLEKGVISKEEANALVDRGALTAQIDQRNASDRAAERRIMLLQQMRAVMPRQPGSGELFFDSLSRSFSQRQQQIPPSSTTCETYAVAGQLRTTCR